MKAVLFKPGERGKVIEIENELTALQKAVGGYIETVTIAPDACLICNEEGILLGLKPQRVWRQRFFGNVLLVGVKGDEFTDAPVRLRGTE